MSIATKLLSATILGVASLMVLLSPGPVGVAHAQATADKFSDLEPAIAANPYLEFTAKVDESGTFKFTWVDDDGTVITTEESITVS